MPASTLVILNPVSGGGRGRRRFRALEPVLRDGLGELEVARTTRPRDAERLAREGVRAGVSRIVVAGGDGTASEVASGLLAAGLAGECELALLPLGTGGDLCRSVGVPRDPKAACALLASGRARPRVVDVGRIRYTDRAGKPRESHFLNVASFGISGLVDELVNRAPRRLGGSGAFALGTLRAIARYRPEPVRIQVDGERVHDGPLSLAAAANGRCFGGGMRIAPEADPADGLLDLVVIAGLPKPALLANFPSIYRGRHLDHPAVSLQRGVGIEAEAAPGRVWLDVDGEPLGTLPARIDLQAGALRILADPEEPGPAGPL